MFAAQHQRLRLGGTKARIVKVNIFTLRNEVFTATATTSKEIMVIPVTLTTQISSNDLAEADAMSHVRG